MSAPGPVAHTRYRFVVRGELGDHFAVAFQEMQIERIAGTTIINGRIVDQSHLHGFIERIQEPASSSYRWALRLGPMAEILNEHLEWTGER